MSNYHLRPVSEGSPSPSPSDLAAGERSPSYRNKVPPVLLPSPPASTSNMNRSRRPLSPSSLRDVILTPDTENPSRNYPAPPTGHDLMAMFPPAPPAFTGMGPNTSGYFQRQERAFFAQAGKEIVRVRLEVDVPQDIEMENGRAKGRNRDTWPPSGHGQSPHPPHRSPPNTSAGPPPTYPHQPNSRQSRGAPVPITPTPLNPVPHHHSDQPPNPHPPTPYHSGAGLHTPPHDSSHSGPPTSDSQSDEFRDNPDEAWRRPMPYAERRRAGKHTRRVVVRN